MKSNGWLESIWIGIRNAIIAVGCGLVIDTLIIYFSHG